MKKLHGLIILLWVILLNIDCSKPTMTVLPKDFHVGPGRAALGVVFDPQQPFFGKPDLIHSSFGPGNPMENFTHFFRSSLSDAVLRNSLFSRVVFIDDSIQTKKKGFPYGKHFLEVKIPSQTLEKYASEGTDFLMILQNFTIDMNGKNVADYEPMSMSPIAGAPMIDHLGEKKTGETNTGMRLKFSAKALIVKCSNDSVISFGNVIIDNSAVDLSRSDWLDNINDLAEEIFEDGPFHSSAEVTIEESR
ncbi:MAG: hypothetical protein GX556_13760 [Fibrobacter sp.]|nr:hypothetical protein [Fibrobacter sp.]